MKNVYFHTNIQVPFSNRLLFDDKGQSNDEIFYFTVEACKLFECFFIRFSCINSSLIEKAEFTSHCSLFLLKALKEHSFQFLLDLLLKSRAKESRKRWQVTYKHNIHSFNTQNGICRHFAWLQFNRFSTAGILEANNKHAIDSLFILHWKWKCKKYLCAIAS